MQRLMIVAGHVLMAQTVRRALRHTAGFEVMGWFDGRGSVRDSVRKLQPDVALVDDMQPAALTLERLREVREGRPEAQCVLLASRMDAAWLDEAFEAGAHAVVSKTVHAASLGMLLREITRGNVVHRHQQPRLPSAALDCPLTGREIEILSYVAEGFTNARIARELWVTEQTVKFHLSNAYRKLGVANRTEASRYALLHNLTAPRTQLAS
jgi:DNA-binding NarL/FixJ family response regulator